MIRILDKRTVEVNLPSKIGYERIAMECSAQFGKMAGLPPERIEDLKTAVSEACLNAMEHGNKLKPEARVVITMKRGDENFSVTVMDEGEGIKKIPEPDINKKIGNLEPPNGLGLFLIEQLVDNVEFNEMTKDGHSVRMVIKVNQ
jgi:serine/threonine-protein kinase RsbW